MLLKRLDVVNACLATMGESPLVEIEDDHPLVAAALLDLKTAMTREMSRKWWFNQDFIYLQQANDKFIYIPGDAISCVPHERDDLTVRGRRLFDRYNNTYEIQGPVLCYILRSIPFEDLPAMAQVLVRDRTVLSFQLNYDADDSKTAELKTAYLDSYRTLNAENTRQINANVLRIPGIATKRRRAGNRVGRPVTRWGI